MKVFEAVNFIDEFAPFKTALSYDNCGLLIGNNQASVGSCVIALDLTQTVLQYAIKNKSNLIITHHPVIFNGVKTVFSEDILYKLINEKISVIAAHTNLDLANGGVNDVLAKKLELENIMPFENEENVGRIGELSKEMAPEEFALYVKEKLSTPRVSFVNLKKSIKTVAIVGGEGSDYLFDAKNYDAYLTGEVKHHILSNAQNANIQIFVAGHFETEAVILNSLKAMLEGKFIDTDFLVYDKSGIETL